jgi:hypothetical protein
MRRRLCVAMVVVACLVPALHGLHADELLLKYDDGMADAYKSFGGSGHAISFTTPDDKQWYVSRIDVCASQYGGGYDPANTFVRAYVCDGALKSIGEGQAAYQLFPYGRNQDWGSIDMPLVPVKGPFVVIVAPGSLQNRGLFVAYDNTGKTAQNIHSAVGSPGREAKPVDQPLDWMIRCTITDEQEALAPAEETGNVLSWDDGSADDQQSFGGSMGMAVKFDPPDGEGVLDAVRLYGSTYGTGQGADRTAFTLAICDADMKVLSNNMYPYALFTSDAHWVRVDLLPDVPVKGPFYVVYVGHCMQTDGVYLGIDTAQGAGKSFLGSPGALSEWSFRLPQNQVNWMIRAELKKP